MAMKFAALLKTSALSLAFAIPDHPWVDAADGAAVRAGQVKKGETLLLEGVGGGFTWGAVLLKM